MFFEADNTRTNSTSQVLACFVTGALIGCVVSFSSTRTELHQSTTLSQAAAARLVHQAQGYPGLPLRPPQLTHWSQLQQAVLPTAPRTPTNTPLVQFFLVAAPFTAIVITAVVALANKLQRPSQTAFSGAPCAPWKSQIASSSRHSFQLCAAADGSKLPEVNNQSQDAPLTNNELRIAALSALAPPPAVVDPLPEVTERSYIQSLEERKALYAASVQDPEKYWAEVAEGFHWQTRWHTVRRYNYNTNEGPIHTSWFDGATTNICYNAVDRHVQAGKGDKVAFIYEGNDGESDTMTYRELLEQTCQLANVLKKHGVKEGDRVTLYLPMMTLAPVAMLAVARIGAVLNTVFGGFSSTALAARILDSGSKIVITADSVARGTKPVELKKVADEACALCSKEGHQVETVLCWERRNRDCAMTPGRDFWLQDEMKTADKTCEVVWRGAEDPLFLLYTSGSTGKPKGVVHTTGGYMVYAATTVKYIFDMRDDDVYWCTADIGWITGHTYATFGPLLNAGTSIIFEGVPTHPDPGVMWKLCEKHRVTIFYTAPTAIRALMKFGDDPVKKYDLSSLRVLGSVGEPINSEAWNWYYTVVGNRRCTIVDTWWQTETGGIMITPLPGSTPMKPSSATLPFFGVEPAIIDDKGNELEGVCEGFLVMKKPHPGICRSVYGDHKRYEETYFKVYPGYYFTGDGCRRDEDGYYWITGRVDDVLNVSGHRLGTAEIESAINTHPDIIESAVVGVPHDIKGVGIYAYVTARDGVEYTDKLKKEIAAAVRQIIGPIATPDIIHPAPGLPKTRSGKIMRRILRKIATKELDQLGDISTLADPSVVTVLLELHPGNEAPGTPLTPHVP